MKKQKKKQNPKIVVTQKLKSKLDTFFKAKGDTYEKIIWRLIKVAEQLNKKRTGQ